MKRSLALRSETLTELAADDLRGVVGGEYSGIKSCLIHNCLTEQPLRCEGLHDLVKIGP